MEISQYNYYDILEISAHCPQHEVTTAFERARATYAGENAAIYTVFSQEEARELLKLVEEAYAVLGNKTLRNLYDEKLSKGIVKPEDVSFQTLKSQSQVMFPEPTKKTETVQKNFKIDEEFEKKCEELKDWTGEWLKKVREYRQVSIDRLSEITKISPYYLKALEAEDPSNLPAPVFVRGYVLQFCRHFGLNENVVATSYMKRFRDLAPKS